MLLSFSDSLSGLFFALLGVYLFFASSATKLHFFLGVFLHFITGADTTLGVDLKPNTLTMRLNVNAGRLLNEYGIRYENSRSHAGRKITLALMPPQA